MTKVFQMDPAIHDALIHSASTTIIECGFDGATTRRIAERAGVNEVTLFRYFGTKANLLTAALRAEAAVFEQIAVHFTGDLEADLTFLATEYLTVVHQYSPLLPLAYFEVTRRPELAPILQGQLHAFHRATELFERYQQIGVLRPLAPGAMTLQFLGPLVFGALIHSALPDARDSVELLQPGDLVQSFLYGQRVPFST